MPKYNLMPHFEKRITNFEEVVIENTSGKIVLLQEFHVPHDFTAMGFNLQLIVKDSSGTIVSYYANGCETKDKHIVDLANNIPISIPIPKRLSVRVEKPSNLQETELAMIIRYQLK